MIKQGMKVGEHFTDGGLTYEVLAIVPEGYISKMVDDFPMPSPVEVKEVEKLTKTAIKRMSKEKLVEICEEKGIATTDVDEMRQELIKLL